MSALVKFDPCSNENLAAPETCGQAIIEIHRVVLRTGNQTVVDNIRRKKRQKL